MAAATQLVPFHWSTCPIVVPATIPRGLVEVPAPLSGGAVITVVELPQTPHDVLQHPHTEFV